MLSLDAFINLTSQLWTCKTKDVPFNPQVETFEVFNLYIKL